MLVMNSRLDASFDGFGAAGIGAHLVPERGRERLQFHRWEHGQFADILHPEYSKGLLVESSKPFVFFHELVAGVRFELTTFGL
jgi:hypothetical protein